ncbi:MAG: hypothetical protein EOO04_36220, partial [Chitinophagaceae bacterium]
MKRYFYLLLVLLSATQLMAQSVKLHGKLLNSPSRKLELVLIGDAGLFFQDSVMLDTQGNFSYQTNKITQPVNANLTNRKSVQIQLFIAPG